MAVFPTTRGLGYAVFEGARAPIDWGTKVVRGDRNKESLSKLRELLAWFRPAALILEDHTGKDSRKSARIKRLIEAIKRLAKKKGIRLFQYSRRLIRQCFTDFHAFNKHEIAKAIAKELPEFVPYVPRKRRPWMSEAHRMAMFDATALIFTFYHFRDAQRA
ncbi:MAG: hypothetical protein ACYTG7_25500 [Planctomycetota bacterium]|jgi:hypothetical protein